MSLRSDVATTVISWYCINCRASASQCPDLFSSRWIVVTQHWPASRHIFYHGSTQSLTPLLGSSVHLQDSSTSLLSSASSTGWRLQSGLLSGIPSSWVCTFVPQWQTLSSGRHRGSVSTSFYLVITGLQPTRLTTAGDRTFLVASASSYMEQFAKPCQFCSFKCTSHKCHLFSISFHSTRLYSAHALTLSL